MKGAAGQANSSSDTLSEREEEQGEPTLRVTLSINGVDMIK